MIFRQVLQVNHSPVSKSQQVKLTAGLDGHWSHDILVLGADPCPQLAGGDLGHPAAGLLGECSLEDYGMRL